MITAQQLEALDPQVRQAMLSLMSEVAARDEQLRAKDALIQQRERDAAFKQSLIDKLTHELAVLKRLKFAATSEKFASTEQRSLLEDTVDADLAELGQEMRQLGVDVDAADGKSDKKTSKRQPLPPHLPRRDVHHEPATTVCPCGCQMQRIGQDVAEKLDYQPGVFTVERHVRGKWACRHCQTLVQAAVPAHVIDKGIPTTGLLAQVLVAKFLDHLPLYRQEAIFERAGHVIARSTLAQWVGECGALLQPLVDALSEELRRHVVLHADETPVACSSLEAARRTGHTCGRTARRAAIRPRRWYSSSAKRAAARTYASSCDSTPPKLGEARWSLTGSVAIEPASTRA